MNTSGSSAPFKTNFYYGWVIVFIAGMGVFFSGPGQTYSVSVFIDSYIKDFGWSRSHVSAVYSLATLAAGICMFFVGRFVDKWGQRKMSVIVGIGLALASFWNSMVVNTAMLFIGFFLIRVLGQGSMSLIPNTLVPQWFITKRGKAMSLMAIGGFASSAALPPLNAWLVATWGWSFSWKVWGVLLLVVFVPLAYFLIRNKPEDIGEYPDGVKPDWANDPADPNRTIKPFEEVNWTVQEAVKTRAYWLLLFCVGIPSLVNTGLTFHLISIFKTNGISPAIAALVLSLMALIGFPVTLIAGPLLDRVKVQYVLAGIFTGEIIFILVLLAADQTAIAIAFGVLWGISGGFERITLNYVWPSFFGRKSLGSIKGSAMTVTVLGSALGPLPFGLAYDYFGGYEEILLMSIVLPVLGMIASLLAKKPVKEAA
ncbi:MFS transporter [Mesobacillus selenatarsenatis]|uniref:Bll3089 protein n=1 Tax=Mesobacillus selenatarsenatis (strain DSM 18680 / JCM 14380 / FERM P-15431 / SF-1) TaxID=1321606 RepID=A0A0A8X642_MESS1|nr:MFS transporter [Mesobacillus selenatarsenatis]GAM15383.1 Bll3089 protein [Mesobacillus selenatarsenatis SF-1]